MMSKSSLYIGGFVLAFYFLFTMVNMHSLVKSQPVSLYHYLTDSFMAKRTDFMFPPPEELLKLKDPYNFSENRVIKFRDGRYLHAKVHDASLYHNKFYIYFSPIPVLIFYLPFKYLTGFYPSEILAILFFTSVGFFASFKLLNKIRIIYFPNLDAFSMLMGSILIGFGPNVIFLLARPKIYEVAISSALCFMSVGSIFLFNIFHKKNMRVNLFFCSLFLMISVAARPHFLLAVSAVIVYILYDLWKRKLFSLQAVIALILPYISIGIILAGYNYLRFDSLFEFGTNYQLIGNLHGRPGNTLQADSIGSNIIYNFYNYFFRPLVLNPYPPYIKFPIFWDFVYLPKRIVEETVGLFVTSPFIIYALFLPKFFKNISPHFKKFIISYAFIPGFIIVALLILSPLAQRYIADFSLYLSLLAVLAWWLSQNYVSTLYLKVSNTIFITMGFFSIYVSLLIGFGIQ